MHKLHIHPFLGPTACTGKALWYLLGPAMQSWPTGSFYELFDGTLLLCCIVQHVRPLTTACQPKYVRNLVTLVVQVARQD